MVILPGLTSTKKDRIPAFVEALARSGERRIALFPTCLAKAEREALYRELAGVRGLRIPHVHMRSDCPRSEFAYLSETFGTEAFNIHPRGSTHPFGESPGPYAAQTYVENVDVPVEDAELAPPPGETVVEAGAAATRGEFGGICPDFSHLENARLHGRESYVATTIGQLRRFKIGCCHLSAIRVGVPNDWSGEWDHHAYSSLADFEYLSRYRALMPSSWASLELENSFEEQLEARAYIEGLLSS